MGHSDKPARPQHVFTVQRTERLTPHMVRVHLGGDAFDSFVAAADPDRIAATDHYVKLLLPPNGSSLQPPFDLAALRSELPKSELPSRRTYTIRSIDTEAREIAIDFVVHGDTGIAGPWALQAQPGDLLAMSGPGGGYRPTDDETTTHLIVGDDSALPAISSAAEALAPGATGTVIIEVGSAADVQPIPLPSGVTLTWLYRETSDAMPGVLLADAVAALERPSGAVQIFAHGERAAMKRIRRTFQDDWGIEKRDMSLSAYWALGRAEDRFQEEKREPIGVIFTD